MSPSLDVLAVDDDEDMRELVESMVIAHGHRCRMAVDGVDALRVVISSRPPPV